MILNLTQHHATNEQLAQGVVDCSNPVRLANLLTFEHLPTRQEIEARAEGLAMLVYSHLAEPKYAMVGGAPYLMAPLESALRARGITPVYAFSQRVSVETVAADGAVTKTAVFKHLGFVGAA